MSYKKISILGTDDALKFGKYVIARYNDNEHFSRTLGKGSILLIYKNKACGTFKDNIIRKIRFDMDTKSIIIESRLINSTKYHQIKMENITNKGFFEYVRKHVKQLFGNLYDITPNKDNTVFKLKKKN